MPDVQGVDPRIYGQFAEQEAQQAKLQQDAAAERALAQARQAQAQRDQADLALKYAQAPDQHQKALDEHQKSVLDSLKAEAEVGKTRSERGLQLWRIAQATGSPGAYAAGRRYFIQDAEDEQAIPPTMPDPETFDKMINTSVSVKDLWEHNEKAVDHFVKGDTQKGLAYGILGSAHDPDALQEFLQHAPSLGASPALVQSLGQMPPEQLQQWAQDRLTTPAEQETARHNLASEAAQMGSVQRMGSAQAETARHNRAMEARPVGGAGGAGVANPMAAPGKADLPDVPVGEKNEAYLATLDTSTRALVKALTEGRKSFPSGIALRAPYWQGILNAVAKYDPSFDEVNYGARAATRKDFTSGKSAQQIQSLNTTIGHIKQLSDLAEALNNRDSQTYNRIANALSTEFGWTGKTDFDTVAPKVAQELTRVWRGTGGSESDIQRDIDALGSSNARSQLRSSIRNLGGLLESKLDALKETYRQGMGTADIEMISPEARQSLNVLKQRAGGTPQQGAAAGGRMRVVGPNGQTGSVPAGTALPPGWRQQ